MQVRLPTPGVTEALTRVLHLNPEEKYQIWEHELTCYGELEHHFVLYERDEPPLSEDERYFLLELSLAHWRMPFLTDKISRSHGDDLYQLS